MQLNPKAMQFALDVKVSVGTSENTTPQLFQILEGKDFTIGRSDCDLTLHDRRLSRKHLALTAHLGKLIAKDQESRNGSFHNEKPFSIAELSPGDKIKLGEHIIQILEIIPSVKTQNAAKNTEEVSTSRSLKIAKPRETTFHEDAPSRLPFLKNGQWDLLELFSYYKALLKEKNNYWHNVFLKVPKHESVFALQCLYVSGFILYGLIYALSHGTLFSKPFPAVFGSIYLGGFGFLTYLYVYGNVQALSRFKGWIKINASFEELLAFEVYRGTLIIPGLLLAGILPMLGSLLLLIPTSYAAWVFYKVFKPNAQNYLIFLLFSLFTACALILMFTPILKVLV